LFFPVLRAIRVQGDRQCVYSSFSAPPKSNKDIGLTGGATFKGMAFGGSSFFKSINTLSTAGRHVRPPQKPIPARVRNFNSRAEQSYFFAVSFKSDKVTSSHRHIIKSCMSGLLANYFLKNCVNDYILTYKSAFYDMIGLNKVKFLN